MAAYFKMYAYGKVLWSPSVSHGAVKKNWLQSLAVSSESEYTMEVYKTIFQSTLAGKKKIKKEVTVFSCVHDDCFNIDISFCPI